MVVKQYPHTLHYTPPAQDTVDDQGYPVPGTPFAPISVNCRLEGNESGGVVKSNDGGEFTYSFILYLPKKTAAVPYGVTVEVKDGETVIGSGKAERFHRGQLNARLWV